jgi:predicted aspartyl protease
MTRIEILNSTDLENSCRGLIRPDEVRSAVIEALVDTGATMLALPEDVVRALGSPVLGTRKARDARGMVIELSWVGNLRLRILGREMTADALVIPSGPRH